MKEDKKLRVGLVGCGNISSIYLENCRTMFRNLEIVAVCDLVPERAKAQAAKYGVARSCGLSELLAMDDLGAILNLTLPKAHAEIALAALEAGKPVYGEKPLAIRLSDGEKIVELAGRKSLALGSAPDTFLGAGLQTCRKLVDDGWIGRVLGATAFMLCGGHESWHPDPAFYYQAGGGPMFDMGPYYLHALISLIGPVTSLTGRTSKAWEERVVTSKERFGQRIKVEVPTSATAILEFEGGAEALLMTSFDAPGGSLHAPIEIYGSEGTLIVPDPNTFGGPIRLRRKGASDFLELPLLFAHAENSRGLGLSDLARAIDEGRSPRASGELALHALEIMEGIHVSSDQGQRYVMRHRCARPAPMDS